MNDMPSHARPGPRNLLTDVPGLKVGQGRGQAALGGVTTINPRARSVCAADFRGGARISCRRELFA